MSWVRLWTDMPTDPKWRVIARKSGRPLSEVLAVFVMMLTNAGSSNTNAAERSERGRITNWSDEDVAAALDMESSAVAAIRGAMQGKTIDGDRLTGWEKRQPKREDGSSERGKQWRERKRTQANAEKRPDTDSDSDSEDNPPKPPQGGAALADFESFKSKRARRRDRVADAYAEIDRLNEEASCSQN